MLCTLAEAKTILRKNDATDDDSLSTLLEYAQEDLVEYLNNHFQDRKITYYSSGIAFVKGDPDTITDSDSEFVNEGFTEGMDVAVEWAYANNGIYELDTVTAGTLTLTTSNELVDMDPDDDNHPIGGVRISLVNWPKPLKMVCAKMAWFLYTEEGARPDDMRAKTMDGTVIEYAGSSAYPKRILMLANKWRRPRFV